MSDLCLVNRNNYHHILEVSQEGALTRDMVYVT